MSKPDTSTPMREPEPTRHGKDDPPPSPRAHYCQYGGTMCGQAGLLCDRCQQDRADRRANSIGRNIWEVANQLNVIARQIHYHLLHAPNGQTHVTLGTNFSWSDTPALLAGMPGEHFGISVLPPWALAEYSRLLEPGPAGPPLQDLGTHDMAGKA